MKARQLEIELDLTVEQFGTVRIFLIIFVIIIAIIIINPPGKPSA